MSDTNDDRIFTEAEAEEYINAQVEIQMTKLRAGLAGSGDQTELQGLRDEVAGLQKDLADERERPAREAEANRITREKLDKMKPEEVNRRWPEIQDFLRSAGDENVVTKGSLAKMSDAALAKRLPSLSLNEVRMIPEDRLNRIMRDEH